MKDYIEKSINEKANVLKVQKHMLDSSQNKLSEIDALLNNLNKSQNKSSESLDSLINDMDILLSQVDIDDTVNYESELDELNSWLDNIVIKEKDIKIIDTLDNVKSIYNSWDEYLKDINSYAVRQNIDLTDDPFKSLMTQSQIIEIQKRIKEDFTYKNAKCDKYDYMIAGTCGIIAGLVDILFVGTPLDSSLGNAVDEQANKITEKFAGFLGWDRDKAVEKGKNVTASAIGFLENKFRINYDQATTHATGGLVENLSFKNHHLKSLGHSPDIIGLFFSILNQFTNTSSFISNGEIITIETEDFELRGHNFIAKIFCGVANWFGHIMSDWTGSSGTVGQGGRGTGVPIPFYNLFQMIDIGEFGQHKQTFATITTKVFEQGYDLRHGATMAIPVVINELLIRLIYTMKQKFYHNKEWKDCIPSANVPELRRMLLVGHGILCLIDGADAAIRSGGDMVQFLLRTNLIAWLRFGHLGLKELNAWYNEGKIDNEAIDNYLEKELKEMLR